jgi:hypothetical protein
MEFIISTAIFPAMALEVVSKLQIRFKSKAQTDEKAQSRQRRDEQYILKRFATQLLGLRWGFENTSKAGFKPLSPRRFDFFPNRHSLYQSKIRNAV